MAGVFQEQQGGHCGMRGAVSQQESRRWDRGQLSGGEWGPSARALQDFACTLSCRGSHSSRVLSREGIGRDVNCNRVTSEEAVWIIQQRAEDGLNQVVAVEVVRRGQIRIILQSVPTEGTGCGVSVRESEGQEDSKVVNLSGGWKKGKAAEPATGPCRLDPPSLAAA